MSEVMQALSGPDKVGYSERHSATLDRDMMYVAVPVDDPNGSGPPVAIVRVAILDAQNRVVPTADNEVTFAIQGAATVAGVGNGDASSHEPDKASKRHAFNGYCLVILQNNGKTGGITLTATSPGLQSATIKLSALKADKNGQPQRRASSRLDAGLPGY